MLPTKVVCLLGFMVSMYAIFVEMKKTEDDSYSALCDFSETISCSRVFASDQGKIWSYLGIIPKDSVLDQPNAVYGTMFYSLVMVLDHFPGDDTAINSALVLLGTSGLALSAYLAYILLFVLKDTCLVCAASYVCNVLLFKNLLSRYLEGNSENAKRKKRA